MYSNRDGEGCLHLFSRSGRFFRKILLLYLNIPLLSAMGGQVIKCFSILNNRKTFAKLRLGEEPWQHGWTEDGWLVDLDNNGSLGPIGPVDERFEISARCPPLPYLLPWQSLFSCLSVHRKRCVVQI